MLSSPLEARLIVCAECFRVDCTRVGWKRLTLIALYNWYFVPRNRETCRAGRKKVRLAYVACRDGVSMDWVEQASRYLLRSSFEQPAETRQDAVSVSSLTPFEKSMHGVALRWFEYRRDPIDPRDPELIRGARAYAKGFREKREIPFFLAKRKWPPTR